MVKRLPIMREARVQSLGWEDLLEKEMATHSSILAWRIPWTDEPSGQQSMGSQRVRHDQETNISQIPFHGKNSKKVRLISSIFYKGHCIVELVMLITNCRTANCPK